jgi:hypothetical protein
MSKNKIAKVRDSAFLVIKCKAQKHLPQQEKPASSSKIEKKHVPLSS